MLTTTQTGVELQLHVDAAGLWYGAAGYSSQCWGEGPAAPPLAALLATPLVCRAKSIRVLGTRQNAWLITQLSALQSVGQAPRKLLVGSPDVLRSVRGASPRNASLFAAMRDLAFAGSLGGWHSLTAVDAVSYALSVAVQADLAQPDAPLSEMTCSLLQHHAAWPALAFLPAGNHERWCLLLSEILDPRWYADRSDPDSLRMLYGFLGLKSQASLLAALRYDDLSDRHMCRARLAASSWYGDLTLPPPDSIAEPAYFFHRVLANHQHKIRGWLEASRLFVVFLRSCWLQSLAPPGRELFVPEYFFTREDEIAEFRRRSGMPII